MSCEREHHPIRHRTNELWLRSPFTRTSTGSVNLPPLRATSQRAGSVSIDAPTSGGEAAVVSLFGETCRQDSRTPSRSASAHSSRGARDPASTGMHDGEGYYQIGRKHHAGGVCHARRSCHGSRSDHPDPRGRGSRLGRDRDRGVGPLPCLPTRSARRPDVTDGQPDFDVPVRLFQDVEDLKAQLAQPTAQLRTLTETAGTGPGDTPVDGREEPDGPDAGGGGGRVPAVHPAARPAAVRRGTPRPGRVGGRCPRARLPCRAQQ
ncbi:hypothetical protein SAMN05428944_8042 [Streptomyces sp. 1222.5]|nr:hypothetical protein BX260_8052 [Streptomyces sp. 5112.2]SED86715.1 hypothetical protein SAMN05428944_8042 [Streptomyces sp. 1222.5]